MESNIKTLESKSTLSEIKNYFSLVKFAHTIFAMPFALIGFFYGLKTINFQLPRPWWMLFILVILCMVFARSAAMAFNRWLDADYDAINPRTLIREIPGGIISKRNAMIFVVINCLAFIVTTYFINVMCLALSPVALFVILFYSYTKRFTPLCHLVLGLGLSLAPIGAYIAVTGQFALVPVLFSFSVLFWVSGFDIIYALQDEEFDKENNLYSIPSWLGTTRALRVSEYLHFLSAAAVIAAGMIGYFSWLYWAGVLVFSFFLFYQHTLVKPKDLSKVNKAFFSSNGIASVVFCVFVLLDIFTKL
ncbi:MAG: putative 4-hydroxybenzoate polyprenyltransferase [Bacteroidota bacterium]|nr:putative 4-hydroxybenzoate polyprenyltransferase [Bacteroidota bacterium]